MFQMKVVKLHKVYVIYANLLYDEPYLARFMKFSLAFMLSIG